MAAISSRHAEIAAKIEFEIWSRGKLVSQAWPWLDMGVELADSDPHDPLLSMARSAAHALARDGKRLATRLVGKPAEEDEPAVWAWCKRRKMVPNWHWASTQVLVLADEVNLLKHAFRKSSFIDVLGDSVPEDKMFDVSPDFYEKCYGAGLFYKNPVILDVISISI